MFESGKIMAVAVVFKNLVKDKTSVLKYGSIFLLLILLVASSPSNKKEENYITLSDQPARNLSLPPSICEAQTTKEGKIQCWDDQTKASLEKGGVELAFNLLAKFYKSDPSFAENCHAMAHRIGITAYKLYSQGVKIKITEESTWCGYGFYHSFVADMMRAGEDLKKASQFCDSVGRQLEKESPELTERCYHGIGHGAVNIHDPRLWGNDRALVEPAIRICKLAITRENQLGACASGVFNAIEIAYKGGQILKLNTSDPFWICREQDGVFKTNCYGYLGTALFRINRDDFYKTIKFIEAIPEDGLANYSAKIIGVTMAYPNIRKADHSDFVKTCNSIQARLVFSCLRGYVSGLMHIGEPGKEYLIGFKFCKTKGMTSEEKKDCFKTVLEESAALYSPAKYNKEICAAVDSEYRFLCKN